MFDPFNLFDLFGEGRRRPDLSALFRSGDTGVLFEPQRRDTLWQDAAGATPVTTYGQGIQRMGDRSGGNSHATQASTASALIYGRHPAGGTRNLLLATDVLATQSKTVTAVAHTLAFTGTGTVTLSGASTAGPLVGTGAGNRVSLTFTPSAGSLTLTVSGSVTLGQLEIGSSATAYQRVGNAYDVTEAGKSDCTYALFDGADNSVATPAINWGSDKATIIAAVRKNSDVAQGCIVSLGLFGGTPGVNAENGLLLGPGAAAAPTYWLRGGGTITGSPAQSSGFVAPNIAVVAGQIDVASDLQRLRVNGSNAVLGTGDLGAGSFGTGLVIYIGRRGGTTLPFNGLLYGLLIINRILSAEELALAERLMAAKCGVTL